MPSRAFLKLVIQPISRDLSLDFLMFSAIITPFKAKNRYIWAENVRAIFFYGFMLALKIS